MRRTGCIDYIELPGGDLGATRRFYAAAFDWRFVEYAPTYVAFEGAGVDGGFDSDPAAGRDKPLVVLYAEDLAGAEADVRAAGGEIVAPPFAFPGGRRFHFRDPAGNELAVWSEA